MIAQDASVLRVSAYVPVVFALLVFARPACAGDMEMVWDAIADGRPLEAQAALREASAADPRTRRLAETVLALARSPLPEGRLDALETTLTDLTQGDDSIAALALYLRGRIAQVHRLRPDYPRAATIYRELAERFPGSHWAQLGRVKLGLLLLHALPEPVGPAARVSAAEEVLVGINEPALRRDLQLQIAHAALMFGEPLDTVLPHLIAADETGGLLGIVAEDLVIQIGELSLRAGHRAQGTAYLQRFLDEFPAHPRRFNIEQRLAEVAGGGGLASEDAP
jgi:hypothetical protein